MAETKAKRTTRKPAAKKKAAPRKRAAKKTELDPRTPAQRVLAALDEQSRIRGEAVLAQVDATQRIVELVEDARRHGVTMTEIAEHVQVMERATRELRPVSRQAVVLMLGGTQPPRGEQDADERVNAAALA